MLLEMRGTSKRYAGVHALQSVDFDVRAGEIHALMGENGAGKSTLIKVLTGAEKSDDGKVVFDGREIAPRTPAEAQREGISTVYQEINLVPALSVAENLFLGRQPRRAGLIDWKRIRRDSQAALARLNLKLDVTQPLGDYSIAIQQMVAIARALDVSAKLLILDEPTSSLDADEVARLFSVMRELKTRGLAVLFVTHFLDQVYAVSDRITVLRNGKLIGQFEAAKFPRAELVAKMMGKELAELTHVLAPIQKSEGRPKARFLQASGVSRRGAVEPMDLEVARGEIVGLAGLLGSGRTETARLLFGLDEADSGEIRANGRLVAIRNPRAAIRARFGFCPEDRKSQAIIPDLSIRENMILSLQARVGFHRPIPRKTQAELVAKFMRALNIAASGPEQSIRTLSGGNQQKVVLARWLASNPEFLILDEPTRGIDVGAKAEIRHLISNLSGDGKSVLLISSELEEMVHCCHRVVVLRDHRKVAEISGPELNESAIMQAIAGASA